MAIDWDAIDEEYPKFEGGKPFAKNGVYKVKIDGVGVGETASGKPYVTFKFVEGEDERYYDIRRWFMGNKPNFRIQHYRRLFEFLGVDETGAKKAVEKAEGAGDEKKIMDMYAQLLSSAAAKFHKEVEIEIRDQRDMNGALVMNPNNGQPYHEAEFTDPSVRFGGKRKEAKVEVQEDEITESDIPF